MHSTKSVARLRQPTIHLSDTDYDVIADLALRMEARSPELSKTILNEIDRAKVYPKERLPKDVVNIGAEVTFLDDSNNTTRTVQLVMPGDADIEAGRVSVMTSVGAGLIGLRVGQVISWPCPDGRARALKILEVEQGLTSHA